MIRLILYFIGLALATWGLAWLADRPGTLTIDWQGREIEISVFASVVGLLLAAAALLIVAWLVRNVVHSPSAMSRYFNRRKQQQGLDALTGGMIAIGAGDTALAARYAGQASRALPSEPLTDLLRAQTAQLAGDRKTAQRIYESMLVSPQTELLGLRGLYLEAERNADLVGARGFAEQAVKRSPKLAWASDALFDLQCKQGDWSGALETLAGARRNDLVTRKVAERRRAVLLTALAMAAEERDAPRAETLALEAHDLAPDLVPAAEIAGRLLASRGRMQKAATVIEQTWKRNPHPDLALIHAHARTGDSPKDRLQRIRKLATLTPGNREGQIAIANAAIEAREWDEARAALEPLLEEGLSARVCVLMARIEGAERGDTGRVREWLARAIHAPRDPVWVADGRASDRWAPVSPVTGKLDAYEWKVTEERSEPSRGALLLEELAELASRREPTIEARIEAGRAVPVEAEAAPEPAATVPATTSVPEAPGPSRPAPKREMIEVHAEAKPVVGSIASLAARKSGGSGATVVDAGAADTASVPEAGEAASEAPASRPEPMRRSVPSGLAAFPAGGKTAAAPAQPARQEADVEFYVPPRAPDDPGTEESEDARAVAAAPR